MKFVCFNTKEPKVGVVYDVLDDLKKNVKLNYARLESRWSLSQKTLQI